MILANAWGATGLVAIAFLWLFASLAVGFRFEGFNHRGLGPSILLSILVGTVGFAAIFLLAVHVQ